MEIIFNKLDNNVKVIYSQYIVTNILKTIIVINLNIYIYIL